jgi:small subunit ribosomal protein S9
MATESKKDIAKKPAAAAKKAPAKKPAAAKKPVVKAAHPKVEKKPAAPVETSPIAEAAMETSAITFEKPTIAKGRYIFATGRRKTAIANVRLFAGSEDNVVNKKKLEVFFSQPGMANKALHPLALTGLLGDFYFTASVNGGGSNAQSEAVRHGIAQALASMNDDMKTVLKKNGFLTRDDRKKERKKPGLRGARRAPQWAKR